MDAYFLLSCTDDQFEKYAEDQIKFRRERFKSQIELIKLKDELDFMEIKARQEPSRLRGLLD